MSNLRTEESQDGLNQNDKILGVNEDGCLINIDADVFAGKVPIKMEDSECADGVSLFKESKTETSEKTSGLIPMAHFIENKNVC